MYKRNEKPSNGGPVVPDPAPTGDTPVNRGGRPEKAIDVELVEKLAGYQLTLDEISAACKVSPATLDNRIAKNPEVREAIERGRATGRASLRRAQMVAANAGNVTMLIWLGKQYLGQKDKFEHEMRGLGDWFNRMTAAELEKYARTGELPAWFRAAAGLGASDAKEPTHGE